VSTFGIPHFGTKKGGGGVLGERLQFAAIRNGGWLVCIFFSPPGLIVRF
jgi:hypothetical protein